MLDVTLILGEYFNAMKMWFRVGGGGGRAVSLCFFIIIIL